MMTRTGDTMLIHLCKPGGQQEGPYTLERIKQDLTANKYCETDYWAWYEGLPEWVPLYMIPGVPVGDAAAAPTAEEAEAPVTEQAETLPAVEPAPAPAEPQPQPAETPEEEPAAARAQVSSGMPVSALEQVFMFTTADGPSAWQSPTVTRMLKEIMGGELSALGDEVKRDVVARCAVAELLKPDGSISEAVWRAMAVHRPTLIQQARERLYRVCVRTFRIEADTVVALVLFYNKEKL